MLVACRDCDDDDDDDDDDDVEDNGMRMRMTMRPYVGSSLFGMTDADADAELWSHMVASSRSGMTPRVWLVTMIVTRQRFKMIVEMIVMSACAIMSVCEVIEKHKSKLSLFGC